MKQAVLIATAVLVAKFDITDYRLADDFTRSRTVRLGYNNEQTYL